MLILLGFVFDDVNVVRFFCLAHVLICLNRDLTRVKRNLPLEILHDVGTSGHLKLSWMYVCGCIVLLISLSF